MGPQVNDAVPASSVSLHVIPSSRRRQKLRLTPAVADMIQLVQLLDDDQIHALNGTVQRWLDEH